MKTGVERRSGQRPSNETVAAIDGYATHYSVTPLATKQA
jgi:hypothetical protein